MKWLTRRGAVAALAVGLGTVYGFGWRGLVLLLAFFVSGSLLTEGGGQRTARQVIANGGVAAFAALAGNWVAFAGAIAAATADTWASEIGRRSPTLPRLITTGKPVPAGTDGGVTALGTAGGVVGAAFVAGLSLLLSPVSNAGVSRPGWFGGIVFAAGVAGMLFDSLLGATLQAKLRWFDNDAVNLAATLTGAGMGTAARLFIA